MKIYRFIATIFLFMALLLGGYVFSLINSSTPTTANFPGKEIATLLTQKWRDLYHTKLDYVAGSRWVGGNIEFYSPDHPAVFIEWSNRKSAWIDNQDLEKKGAIFIWDIDEGENPPRYLRKRYPRLLELEILEVEWQRNTHNLPPIQIGVAILPPGK